MDEPKYPQRPQSLAISPVESVAVAVPTKTEVVDVKRIDPEAKIEIPVAAIVIVTATAVIAVATPTVSVAATTATGIDTQSVIETVETVQESANETVSAPVATDPLLPMAATTQMPDV
jgi:hypothetical protein